MKLPSLLPEDLEYTGRAKTARALYEMLQKDYVEYSRFFVAALEDETWCAEHSAFMKLSLQWFTTQFFRDRLQVDLAHQVGQAMRKHHHLVDRWLPLNLHVRIGDESFPINSLLWATSSEWMRQKIRNDCRDQQSKSLSFDDLSAKIFSYIEEYMHRGEIKNLAAKNQEEIIEILKIAATWHLEELTEESQKGLVKYIDEFNVVDWLIKSHENHWAVLRTAAINYVNHREIGIRIEDLSIEELSFEFLDFRKPALDFFENVRHMITKLICRHRLTEKPVFSEVVNRCPELQTLSVSESENFTDRLLDLPEHLTGIDLSKCQWLNHQNLREILNSNHRITELSLASNVQLNYTAWGLLKLAKGLIKLDISSCHQIADQDLKVILQASRGLTHLNLKKCSKLSDLSFFEIPKYATQLVELDLSDCRVYDAALIEILTKCQKIRSLALRKCRSLSDRAVLEAVRSASSLKEIDLTGCELSKKAIESIQSARPYLNVYSA